MSENKTQPRNAGHQQRNAGAKQDRNSAVKEERSAFDNIGLTKRNADYMFRFNQALQNVTKLDTDKKTEIVQGMVDELIEGQKSGMTAKSQYGDIKTRIDGLVNGPKRPVGADDPFWPSALYNGLTFFMFFGVMFGIMYFFAKGNQTGQQVGIVSVLFSAIIAGIALPMIPRAFDTKRQHRFNIWIRILFALIFVVIWLGLFYGMAYLPWWMNPIIPAWLQIALGVIAGGAAYLVRRKWKLTQGFFSTQPRR